MKLTKKGIWEKLQAEGKENLEKEPLLTSFIHETILNHTSFESALAFHLANKLSSPQINSVPMWELIHNAFKSDTTIITAAIDDLEAIFIRDPAAGSYLIPFLFYKGYHALQCYRVTHRLWKDNRRLLAGYLQNQMSEIFAMDIHPAATIGHGIMIDHGTSIVIGETAVVENNVSILHEVTLGGTGKDTGDRHPKVREGVLIGAGAKILGNIEIGCGAKIGAGSVVLKNVPPHTTYAGVPARYLGKTLEEKPSLL
ncbi:MAG TPA: serine O-acetyltransferase, partial [Spirochaetota bacterium]